MPLIRCILLAALVVLVAATPAGTASAHNSLVSSDPTDGATLTTAPTQITFIFDKSVPLDTLSVEYVDSSGVRSDLTGSVHGASDDTEVVTPLPPLPAGEVTMRWRLVGPDGHPITGRVSFTIAQAATTTVATAAVTTAPAAVAAATTPTSTLPATTLPATTLPAMVPAEVGDESGGFEDPWTTPDATRWIFRMGSYLAIMAVGGIIATSALVWPRAWSHHLLRRVALYAIGFAVVLAVLQLLVIASDIEGVPLWSAASGLSAAFETDAGVAFGLRIVILGLTGAVLFLMRPADEMSRWFAAGTCTLASLGTWAYAGHSQSMRWSFIGIPFDVAHHAAAAAWLGGLAIVGLVAIRDTGAAELVGIMQRFARLAAISVAVIVGTGAIQALRLVGSPTQLLAVNHGRYLLVKLVVLGVMLKLADLNRRRVNRRFQTATTATPHAVYSLRRAMGTELGVGLAIIAITAAMVVSPPAVADDGTASEPTAATARAAAPATPATTTVPPLPTSAAASTTSTASCTINAELAAGATTTGVECVQRELIARGYLTGSPTGQFDDATDQAVRGFQTAEGLFVDGIVGPVTADALGIWSE